MAVEPVSPSDAGFIAVPGRDHRPLTGAPLPRLGLTRSPGAGKSSAGALCPGVARMVAPVVRHETRALLRAHLAASTGYRHVTRHCAVCHRLQRLAMELAEPAYPDAGGTTINSSAPNLPPEADSDPH
ncbi:DUF6274 family protein [Streptomyces niveus]|uniref:DUF6274 family protein n=1 Tax=Streptomyces niveus TaxID=193462 RepID=UPI003F4DD017